MNELKEIAAAVLVLTAAFVLIFYREASYGYIYVPAGGAGYGVLVGISLLTVLTAFLLHELAHRYVARRLGGFGRFRIWPIGAIFALITSLLGFLFAAPGAVYISGLYGNDAAGKASLAGPGANMVMAVIFYGLYIVTVPFTAIAPLFGLVGALNSWWAVFNMLPVGPLDGAKVLRWDQSIYIGAIATAVLVNIPAFLYFGFI